VLARVQVTKNAELLDTYADVYVMHAVQLHPTIFVDEFSAINGKTPGNRQCCDDHCALWLDDSKMLKTTLEF